MRMYQSLNRSFARPHFLGSLAGLGERGNTLEAQASSAHSNNDHAGAQNLYMQAAAAYNDDSRQAQYTAQQTGSYTTVNQLAQKATAALALAADEARHIVAQKAAEDAAAAALAQAQAQAAAQAAAQAQATAQAQAASQAAAQQAAQLAAQQAAADEAARQDAIRLQQQQTAQLAAQQQAQSSPTVSTQPVTSTSAQQKSDVVSTSQPPVIIPAASSSTLVATTSPPPIISSGVDSYASTEDFSATGQANLLPLEYNDLSTSAAPETPTTPGTAVGFDWLKLLPWVIGLALLSR